MNKKSKIYTRTGDKGKTSLIGNSRVPKFDIRIEAYGTLDELKSYIGLIRDYVEIEEIKEDLYKILHYLFVAESRVAAESDEFLNMMPVFENSYIEFLEKSIDRMDAQLPPLTAFILPTGFSTSSHIHVARTICRRAERVLLKSAETFPIEEDVITFINRLSDYLFVLARYVSYNNNVVDIVWNSKV
jgi:cob(I)alamin adenosyltransferase